MAVTSWRNHRVIRRDAVTLHAILHGSRYDLATINALPRRLCYLAIVILGASVMLPLRSWRSGQLQAWYKCTPEVVVTPLDSRTNSVEDLVKHERFLFSCN